MDKKCSLYVITGCTASGKSSYAIELAKKVDAEIISCDSLLVYRDMNIGTAKPSYDMLNDVRHHCVDIISPVERFDVAQYISEMQLMTFYRVKKTLLFVVVLGFI